MTPLPSGRLPILRPDLHRPAPILPILLPLLVLAGPVTDGGLRAQDTGAGAGSAPDSGVAVTVEEENFREEPNGALLGRVEADVRLAVAGGREAWIEADLEGWMWARSLQLREEGDFSLVVSAPEGENLRDSPSGAVLARLESGTLLEELERIPGWIRVRRRGWIWRPSVRLEEEGSVQAPAEERSRAAPAGESAVPPAASSDAPPPATGEWRRTPAGGAEVLAAPGGDSLALARPGAELRVLGREGGWTRVRVEGWVWLPDGSDDDPAEAGVDEGVSPAEVSSDPDAWAGRLVAWQLQFVSLERAEEVRTDFYRGEPFLLTRTIGAERSFVYVAIPPERMSDVEGLIPLERIRVVGRVRTGASAFTGSPILDLLELTRSEVETDSPSDESRSGARP